MIKSHLPKEQKTRYDSFIIQTVDYKIRKVADLLTVYILNLNTASPAVFIFYSFGQTSQKKKNFHFQFCVLSE